MFKPQLSATDLVNHLNCRHLTNLDRAAAIGTLEAPQQWDPLLKILWERGALHELQYVEHLKNRVANQEHYDSWAAFKVPHHIVQS